MHWEGYQMRLTTLLLLGGLSIAAAPAALAHEPHDNQETGSLPTQGGQSAFAAIQEIVAMLNANPNTDWSKVDIDALRTHLIDMDNVALRARIAYRSVANGELIDVTGDGAVRDSIQRMVSMHVTMAGDTADWRMEWTRTTDGARVTVAAKSARGLAKMKALGLVGMMADGMHHARHHMMLATGGM